MKLLIHPDKNIFQDLMSTKNVGKTKEEPIVLDDEAAIARVIDAQNTAFMKYENKAAVAISPDDPRKKRAASPTSVEKVFTRKVTKTIKDADGATAAVVTSTKTITRPAEGSAKLPHLSIHGFTGTDGQSKVIPFYDGKLVTKKLSKPVEATIELELKKFESETALGLLKDDPLHQAIAKVVRASPFKRKKS